jgi:hypothetical protein
MKWAANAVQEKSAEPPTQVVSETTKEGENPDVEKWEA